MIVDYMGNMEALVATASMNVSKAELKHFDLKLRPSKAGKKVHLSPIEAYKEEFMAPNMDPNEPQRDNVEVDNEGMQI